MAAGHVTRAEMSGSELPTLRLLPNPARLSFDELIALGTQEQSSDIHCVTRWTKLDMPWKGVPMRALLDQVAPLDSARFVIAHAEQGFTANLPIEAIQAEDVMLAYEADG